MKKLFIIICALFVGIANADNVITSKEYVDTQGATLQPQIPAKNTNTVLTYPAAGTETPGEKAIYDSSAAYATQSDALVTAGDFNNALQTALDTEFVCVSRNDQGCLLYEIKTVSPDLPIGKNVFDSSQILNASGWTETNGVYTGYMNKLRNMEYNNGYMNACNPACKPNTIYTLSYTITNGINSVNDARPYLYVSYTDGTYKANYNAPMLPGETKHVVLTTDAGKTLKSIRASYNHGDIAEISNIQIEEGAVATPYVPYGNVYMPQN